MNRRSFFGGLLGTAALVPLATAGSTTTPVERPFRYEHGEILIRHDELGAYLCYSTFHRLRALLSAEMADQAVFVMAGPLFAEYEGLRLSVATASEKAHQIVDAFYEVHRDDSVPVDECVIALPDRGIYRPAACSYDLFTPFARRDPEPNRGVYSVKVNYKRSSTGDFPAPLRIRR